MRFLRRPDPRDLGLTADAPAFLLGFTATAFQIYLLREFSVHFSGNELVYGIVLASWLFWGDWEAWPVPGSPDRRSVSRGYSMPPSCSFRRASSR